MADPDDMSAASDEESVLGADDVGGALEDSDMLDDDGVPQADPDDDDDDDDDDDEAPKKTTGGMSGIMKHFYKAQGEKTATAKTEPAKVAEVSKKRSALAASTARASAPSDPVPLGKQGASKARKGDRTQTSAPAAPAPAATGGAAKKAKESKEAKEPKGLKGAKDAAFSFEDSEEEEENFSVTLPKNAGLTMSAPDAEQEFEDLGAGGGSSGGAPEDADSVALPRVSDLAKKRRYVMKNEKVKKWAEFKCAGLRFAPDCAELFDFTMDDLNIASKKDRLVMQDKLANEQMSKIIKTLCIGECTQDAVGSVTGPCLSNLMAVIPSTLPLNGAEYDDLVARLGDYDEEEEELVTLVSLDHEIVKRVFLVQNGGGLPSMYNPNTNSSNKYRVAAKLEENAKSDKNFTLLGVIEKAKSTRKRVAEESSNSKSDGKRVANGTPAKPVAEASQPCVPRQLTAKEARVQAPEAREVWLPRRMAGGQGAAEQEVGTVHNEHMVVESVPLDDAINTHCWIMGNRLYWATPRAGSD